MTAGVQGISEIYWPLTREPDPKLRLQGWVDAGFTSLLLLSVVVILGFALPLWLRLFRERRASVGEALEARGV